MTRFAAIVAAVILIAGAASTVSAESPDAPPQYDRDEWAGRCETGERYSRVVSLKQVHDADAHRWSSAQRYEFYDDPLNRVCIPAAVGSSKGARTLDSWERFDDDAWLTSRGVSDPCLMRRDMAEITIVVKRKWGLSFTASERAVIGESITADCGGSTHVDQIAEPGGWKTFRVQEADASYRCRQGSGTVLFSNQHVTDEKPENMDIDVLGWIVVGAQILEDETSIRAMEYCGIDESHARTIDVSGRLHAWTREFVLLPGRYSCRVSGTGSGIFFIDAYEGDTDVRYGGFVAREMVRTQQSPFSVTRDLLVGPRAQDHILASVRFSVSFTESPSWAISCRPAEGS